MFKRTWMILAVVLLMGILISACEGGDLAKDLTPIPTLPKGEEPTLVTSLQGGAATEGDGGAEIDPAELVAMGEQEFVPCQSCHGVEDGVGPAFTGMAERAATRVDGMSAEEYLHESIVNPSAFVVEGFQNIMPPNYSSLGDTKLNALVAYIVAESSGETVVEPTAEPTEAEATEEPTEEPTAEPTAEATEAAPTEEADSETPAAEGDAAAGQEIFVSKCAACHGETDGAGPALVGMGERAAERVEGLSAAEYLHQSIVQPGEFTVDGFANIMPPNYGDQLSETDINNLVAYLLTQ
ncbi:MAG: cytochrome c [Chloroflexi bacterium]|nr:cytochrome c [Chloroflexota bacterium]